MVKTEIMKVLVIASHPDDEVIGCGGTIAKYVDNGDDVYVYIIADGCSARYVDSTLRYNGCSADSEIKTRIDGAKKAADILGIKELLITNLKNQQLDTYPQLQINKSIEEKIDKINPDIVYTHTSNDTNLDHRIVGESTLIAARKIDTIILYEIIFSTTKLFSPNFFVDISNFYDKKLMAMKCYDGEIRKHSYKRTYEGIRAHSRARGDMINKGLVEAFEIYKMIT